MRIARWFVAPFVLLLASTAVAQSDANRAAARALAAEGIGLQDRGRYAEALDRLQRAQSLVDAPTHLLHIAQCQAALGKVVEASETYRALARIDLSANAPTAFKKAQEAGSAELAQLEPKIPWLRIDVTPKNVAGASVTLDGTPVPLALIGVERPANPGGHVLEASAPGYSPATANVTLANGEHKKVPLTLRAQKGAVAAAPAQASGPADGGAPSPSADSSESGASQGSSSGSKLGVVLGGRFAIVGPGGKTGAAAGQESENLLSFVKGGAGIEIDAGLRFAKHFAVFLLGGYDVLTTAEGNVAMSMPGGTNVDASAAHSTFGVGAQIATSQSTSGGTGFFGELDLVSTTYTRTQEWSAGGAACRVDHSLSGPAARLGAGVHLPLGRSFLLSPFLAVEMGQFSKVRDEMSGAGCAGGATGSVETSLDQKDSHQTFLLGIGGAWVSDHD